MLVVAADEGIMPQTREHLEICSLLGIRSGLVALTKTDMDVVNVVANVAENALAGRFTPVTGDQFIDLWEKRGENHADRLLQVGQRA